MGENLSTNQARRAIVSAIMKGTNIAEVPLPNLAAVRLCFICSQGNPMEPGTPKLWYQSPNFNKAIADFKSKLNR